MHSVQALCKAGRPPCPKRDVRLLCAHCHACAPRDLYLQSDFSSRKHKKMLESNQAFPFCGWGIYVNETIHNLALCKSYGF